MKFYHAVCCDCSMYGVMRDGERCACGKRSEFVYLFINFYYVISLSNFLLACRRRYLPQDDSYMYTTALASLMLILRLHPLIIIRSISLM